VFRNTGATQVEIREKARDGYARRVKVASRTAEKGKGSCATPAHSRRTSAMRVPTGPVCPSAGRSLATIGHFSLCTAQRAGRTYSSACLMAFREDCCRDLDHPGSNGGRSRASPASADFPSFPSESSRAIGGTTGGSWRSLQVSPSTCFSSANILWRPTPNAVVAHCGPEGVSSPFSLGALSSQDVMATGHATPHKVLTCRRRLRPRPAKDDSAVRS